LLQIRLYSIIIIIISFTIISSQDLFSSGDLLREEEILGWLVHQKKHSEIPEVTDEMMDRLKEKIEYLAVLFCKLRT
jgi:hypothetical protein